LMKSVPKEKSFRRETAGRNFLSLTTKSAKENQLNIYYSKVK